MIEKVFLGCLLKADYLLKDSYIRPEHLQETRHVELMRKMVELQRFGKNVDLITFTTLPEIKRYGGISYLSELQAFADLEKFDEVQSLLIDSWKEREKKTILQRAALNNWEIAKVIDELDNINQIRVDDHQSLKNNLFAMYEAPWQEKEQENIAPSGIDNLDKITGGWKAGEVTILAARPSMGKTDVMLHFAKEAGWAGFLPIIFSLEMGEKIITSRLIASTGGYNRTKMRNPRELLSRGQKERWPNVIAELANTNIQIFDRPGQTIPEMRAKIRKMTHQHPGMKPIIFVDYLTLIRSNESYNGNSHYQVTEISRNLKTIAKEFACPVICLAQLNRSVETRANKRPLMSDIRESGSVEQDADIIMFLYREKYYDKGAESPFLELIIAKNRNGPVGSIEVKYNDYTGKIEV